MPSRKLLVVLSYALARGGVNRLDLYRWTDDCARPTAAGGYDFGGRSPHELFLWHDPAGARTLAFTTMFGGGAADLQVVDVTDAAAPRLAGTWASPAGLLHSISLGADGHRAYLSLWTGGLLVADATQFTTGQPSPQLGLLTGAGDRLAPLPGGNVHSAVAVPGRDLLVLTDERYPPACPYGPARVADVSDPAHPRPVGVMAAPENDLATCRASPSGTYTSHNPTVVQDLALVTWYSSGLQVFDLSDPAHPLRLAEARPQASEPGQRSPELGAALTMTWSYPIVRDGLVYVADVNQGLYVFRYRGPHEDEVGRVAFAEGNSNLFALLPSPATEQPPAPPTSAPAAGPVRAAPRRAAAATSGLPPALAGVALALLLTGAVLAGLVLARMLQAHGRGSVR